MDRPDCENTPGTTDLHLKTEEPITPPAIPDIENVDFPRRLDFNGRNLASVLRVLRETKNETKDRPEEFLRAVLPSLKRVSVEPVTVEHSDGIGTQRHLFDSIRIALVFHQMVGDSIALFGPRQMSDGTLRTLAVLAALYQVNPSNDKRPSLTAIEDVEAEIHPAVLAVLRDALMEASLSTQVLVTTQSSDLLDSKDMETDSILAVSADNGLTQIAPVDDAGRSVLQKRLYTAGELMRVGHLFPTSSKPRTVEVEIEDQ